MLRDLTETEYKTAQGQVKVALKDLKAQGVDVKSSAFQANFKRMCLKIHETILDDPDTYEV